MTRYSLAQLRQRYLIEGRPLETQVEAELRDDGRVGVKAILLAVSKRRFDNRSEGQRLRRMMRFEGALPFSSPALRSDLGHPQLNEGRRTSVRRPDVEAQVSRAASGQRKHALQNLCYPRNGFAFLASGRASSHEPMDKA